MPTVIKKDDTPQIKVGFEQQQQQRMIPMKKIKKKQPNQSEQQQQSNILQINRVIAVGQVVLPQSPIKKSEEIHQLPLNKEEITMKIDFLNIDFEEDEEGMRYRQIDEEDVRSDFDEYKGLGCPSIDSFTFHILNCYQIASYRDFILLGGGGGYEIENKIEVYQVSNPSQNILKKIVHEEPTGKTVPNFFEFANNADFKKEEASMNCCKFSKDNTLLATGGDDCFVRVFKMELSDFKSSTKLFELAGHCDSVNSVDISPNKKYLISSSSDKSCLIFDLEKKGQRIKKLTFNDGLSPDSKNMIMRGCFFTNDGSSIYTLSTQMRQKSYLVKWRVNENFDPQQVVEVHKLPCTGMKLSKSGNQIGIMTCDGFVKVYDQKSHSAIISEKRHRLPVTCMNFIHDFNSNAEYVISGSADYTYNMMYCKKSIISKESISQHLLGVIFGWLATLIFFLIVVFIISDFM